MRDCLARLMKVLRGGGCCSDSTKGGPNDFHVKVSSREVTNRIVESRVRGHTVRVDQPKEFGADDTAPTPPEYLAIAMGSCIVSTLRFVAMMENLDIRNIAVDVEGVVDFSKAMGVSTLNRSGFGGLKISVRFDGSLSGEDKRRLVENVMSRGAAIDNIVHRTPVEVVVS